MYGAPLMEHFGINAGPITGASIDLFNDPTDSVGDGWAKRMALSAGEVGTGACLAGHGMANIAQGNLLTGVGEGVVGAGLMGLGAFSGAWNTATAVGNGMGVSEAYNGISNVGGGLVDAGSEVLGDAANGIASWF